MANRDLNIILGLSVKGFEESLKRAERSLQRSARRMQSIGGDLTQAITFPIAGIGAAAITAAADFERLQNALTAVTGDANLAAQEIERLRKIAEAPGLGFEQAIRASSRLQAVGLSADQARETIAEYGNAVARSGGGAAEFDGAVLALTQIASKGKISAEEINQLGERIAEIRPVLQAAFGTANSEELQALGVSAEEFIARTTAEFGKLERVQGGLANSLENATIATKAFLAELGNEINAALNLNAVISQFTTTLNDLITGFKALNPEQKATIINLGLYAAAAGPALLVTGKFLNIVSLIPGQLQVFSANIRGAANGVANLAKSFRALSLAQQATVIGLVAVGIAALVAVVSRLRDRFGELAATARTVVGVQQDAAKAAAEEQAKVEPLIDVLKDETAAKAEKRRALDQLQTQYPAYFGNLDAENSKVKDITDAYNRFKDSIVATSRARAAEAKLTELASREIELLAEQQEIANDRQQTGLRGFLARQTAGAGKDALVLREEEVNRELTAISEQRAELAKIVQQSNRQLAGLESSGPAPVQTFTRGGSGAAAGVDAEPSGPIRNTFAQDIDFSQIDRLNEKTIQARENALDWDGTARRLNETLVVQRTELGTLGEVISDNVLDGINRTRDALEELGLKFTEVNSIVVNFGEFSTQAVNQFGNAIAQGASNFADLGKTVARTAIDIIGNLIRVGVTAAISNALKNPAGIIPPLGLALAGAAGAAASGLFRTVISSITAPGLAEGGIIPPGFPNDTFPARLSSGEAVIPLNRLNEFGGGPGVITTRVSGSDLILILERAQKEQNRIV